MRKAFTFGDVPWVVRTAPKSVAVLSPGDAWGVRATANGGSPQTATKNVLTTFYNALVSANILSKMKAVNCFVPDDLVCARTPLIVGPGLDPWTNVGFVSGDLTVNGLVGNASSKYLKTGVNARANLTVSDNGMTILVSVAGAASSREIGAVSITGVDDFCIYADYSEFFLYDYGNVVGGDRASAGSWVNGNAGYLSGNVTSSSSIRCYGASPGYAHALQATGTPVAATLLPDKTIYVFTANDGNVTPGLMSDRRLSFAAIHQGLTEAESSAFFTAINTMRESLGGGYFVV